MFKPSQIVPAFVVAVCLAVSGWVGNKTAQTAEALASATAQLEAMRASAAKTEAATTAILSRLESKLDEATPRREVEARFMILEQELRKTDIKLREIDVEILKLKNRL